MEIIRIAWRNLWRNKRRTLITVASVFFAIWFALVLRGFQLGSYEVMVNNIVHAFSGYFQLHAKGYWADQVLNNAFEDTPQLRQQISSLPLIKSQTGRLESFALASHEIQTKGVMVIGTNPQSEDQLTSLRRKLTEGEYLTDGDRGALVSSRLASYLNLHVGDTIVIIGQGYQGTSAAGVFPVRGIVRFPSPDLDGRLIYLTLAAAQDLFGAPGMLTSVAFDVEDPGDYEEAAGMLRGMIDPELYEVMTWGQMMPEVVQQIKADSASGLIMLGILYMIVGFGVFGTLLMMLNERNREFGMMIAIGMQKTRLMAVLVTETLFLGLIGILAGNIAALAPVYYFHVRPIRLWGNMADSIISLGFEPLMPTAWNSSFFIAQSLVVFCIILMLLWLPVMRIRRLDVITAIRH